MSTGDRTDPYLGFRFTVEMDSLIVGGFSRVEGLAVEIETEEYEEGGANATTRVMPKRFRYPNLSLERGVTDADGLWEWIERAKHGEADRKNVRILLLDSTGAEVRGWEVIESYPVGWEGPDLIADRGQVAVESIELAHEGLRRHGD
ncbi:phage tail protein [Halopenitus sp. H-Gu1]|uniref:phage tail protein n=1 Tax=Halopenitus sp. H-Gu1 TaxID=3242697 RepID=UPI00359E6343